MILSDMQHNHSLNSICDIWDPPSRASLEEGLRRVKGLPLRSATTGKSIPTSSPIPYAFVATNAPEEVLE